jgi:peptidoglycan hydrolase-like protein with peptidoglycan-binding domain
MRNEAPRGMQMKRLCRVLLCLALASASSLRADELVLRVQQGLKQLKLYDGVIDGEMGSQTAAAIRRFQLAEKLKVTGKLNPQTLRNLRISAPNVWAPMEASGRKPEYMALKDLFKGSSLASVGPDVQTALIRKAQKNLRLLGYYAGPADGRPSPSLLRSLKAWQASAGFRATGRFDQNTLKGLALIPNWS